MFYQEIYNYLSNEGKDGLVLINNTGEDIVCYQEVIDGTLYKIGINFVKYSKSVRVYIKFSVDGDRGEILEKINSLMKNLVDTELFYNEGYVVLRSSPDVQSSRSILVYNIAQQLGKMCKIREGF